MENVHLLVVILLHIVASLNAEEVCLLRYDTNSSSVKLDLFSVDPERFRGPVGAPGKKGPVGPPGPIGGSENDTILRQRYDEKIRALEKRLNDLADPTWYLASNGYRYKIVEKRISFSGAESNCKSIGGYLATVGMRHERVKREVLSAIYTETRYGLWIGLTDLRRRHVWIWSDGVSAINGYTDWDVEHKEPNNFGGNERCAHIRIGGKLNDLPCDTQLYALCERSI